MWKLAFACSAVAAIFVNACGQRVSPYASSTSSWRAPSIAKPENLRYPELRQGIIKDHFFGREVDDPYRSLESGGDSTVVEWVARQDSLARNFIGAIPLRSVLASEIQRSRDVADWPRMPLLHRNLFIYERRDVGRERGSLFERARGKTAERVVFDPEAAFPAEMVSIVTYAVSPDERFIALVLSRNRQDAAFLRVLERATGNFLGEEIVDARSAEATWAPDSSGFYYSRCPVEAASSEERYGRAELRFHPVGAPSGSDEVIRPATGKPGVADVALPSKDGNWLLATRWYGQRSTDLYLGRISSGSRRPTTWLQLTNSTATYDAYLWYGSIYIRTNEGAKHWRLFRAEITSPLRASWREIVPERTGATLDAVNAFGSKLVLEYITPEGRTHEVHSRDGRLVGVIQAPQPGTLSAFSSREGVDEASVAFSSVSQPYRPYVLHDSDLLLQPFADAAELSADSYITERVTYTDYKGAPVPMFVTRNVSTTPGSGPVLLKGYGGFGISVVPGYVRGLKVWLDHGGTYAEPVLPGGSELGEEWRKFAQGPGRPNVYEYFLKAAAWLIDNHWSEPGNLLLRGGSAGGLLVSVALTEKPELFAGVVASVPLEDMLRYPRWGAGSLWVDEYGSPDDATAFPVLLRFSPYHQIVPHRSYPPVLVLSNAGDDRVDPAHARKFIARLQGEAQGGPFLLRTEKAVGHYGADSVTSWVETEADVYTFALSAFEHARARNANKVKH